MTDLRVEEFDWPDCAMPGCPNKSCLALNSPFCFPHTPGNRHVKHIDIVVRHIIAGFDVEGVDDG